VPVTALIQITIAEPDADTVDDADPEECRSNDQQWPCAVDSTEHGEALAQADVARWINPDSDR
jgi:hypothetical protein